MTTEKGIDDASEAMATNGAAANTSEQFDDEELLNGGGDDSQSGATDDSELKSMRERVAEMEREAAQLRSMQAEVDKRLNTSISSSTGGNNSITGASFPSMDDKIDADNRSVYVGNVDYGATAEELEAHFRGAGNVNRVTILCDKFSGHPKGFAYIEFADPEAVQTALALDESLFRGRQIKVLAKRTNKPGVSSTNRPPRGRGRARGRGFYRGTRGRGMYRGRGRGHFFSPY